MDDETNNTPISESPPPDQEPEDISNLPVEEQVIALQEHLLEARQEAAQNLDSALRARQLVSLHRPPGPSGRSFSPLDRRSPLAGVWLHRSRGGAGSTFRLTSLRSPVDS